MYFIGIDGGGTKTKFVCYDFQGKVLDSLVLPTCHILQVGKEGLIHILNQGINYFRERFDFKQGVYVGLGLAGYGRDAKLRKEIEDACEKVLYDIAYIIASDAKIALLGALNKADGLLVIAGTGSIVLGKVGNQEYRCGGWGPVIGDDGSGYAMGKAVLNLFSKQSDGRIKKSILYDLVKEKEKLEDDAVLSTRAASFTREQIAHFAYYAKLAASQGDPYCLELYKKTAYELALMMNALTKYYDSERIYASYAGGIFNGKEFLINHLKQYLDARICLIDPCFEPEYGAYLLALELYEKNIKMEDCL